MTVKQIYKGALALYLSSLEEDRENAAFAAEMFNILLGETKQYNNALRKQKGMLPYQDVPYISSLDDPNPYEKEFDTALKYGLASKMLTAQEEYGRADVFARLYYDEIKVNTPYTAFKVHCPW